MFFMALIPDLHKAAPKQNGVGMGMGMGLGFCWETSVGNKRLGTKGLFFTY